MISVMGGGAFGTALAVVLAGDKSDVRLWTRDAMAAKAMSDARENTRYLPGIPLPATLTVTSDVSDVAQSGTILLAIPTQSLGGVLVANARHFSGKHLVACCKGVDRQTGLGPTGLIAKHCPLSDAAVLTGPSFAGEIAAGLPTALTLAAENKTLGVELQVLLSRPTLRIYLSSDPKGAEIGGALKNVVALAAGMCIGAGYGESARASVIARGFAEMQVVASALGGRPETLTGLSGFGDLVLTAMSEQSRNMRAGLALGRGEGLPQGQTIEGISTARAMADLCDAQNLSAPIIKTVADVVEGRRTVAEASGLLLSRPLKDE